MPPDERDTIDAALRQFDFLTEEITTIERDLTAFVLGSPDARRPLSVPGVRIVTAAVFIEQVGTARGDINRFTSPRRLIGYLGDTSPPTPPTASRPPAAPAPRPEAGRPP